MDHAITIRGLLHVVGGTFGVLLIAGGLLWAFAGMMSDAPAQGEAASYTGCYLVVLGLILLAGAIVLSAL